MNPPIFTGVWGKCHIQGIAVDEKNGYIYYSFTTKLVKARLDGTVVGCVDGLLGHLGCIVFNEQDGRVYGSLEYKNDSVGKWILYKLGSTKQLEDAFYIAVFDVDKIDRMDMDAEKDSIMTSVYLKEVVDDYNGTGVNKAGQAVPHKYGCSGIDGTAIGPMYGAQDGNNYLFVAYGIYSDLARADNDHQVILCYDLNDFKQYERPLSQTAMHKSGPAEPVKKLFLYTGNTTYGVQNMEYSAAENAYFMAVYRGKKPEFPNYDLFAADVRIAPVWGPLKGLNEEGWRLTLLDSGLRDEASATRGWRFAHGSTGLYACKNGDWLISQPHLTQSGNCGLIYRYVREEKEGFVLKD